MNTSNRRQWLGRTMAVALLPLMSHAPAVAQDAYPSRTIKWVVPYLAGTSPDNAARIMAEAVGKILKQTIIIENRGGAASAIGTRQVAQAPADGYTLLYTATPLAANMRLLLKPGYDALKDFRHVIRVSTADVALVVSGRSDMHTLDDLLSRLKDDPGQISYASGGVGTPSHLGMELFLSASGTEALHVPYKGASELVNAVIGQQVDFGMPIFSVAYPLIQSGKLRALAIAGSERNPMGPDIPTLAELGFSDVVLTSWGGISVPAGTPEAAVKTLHDAFAQALANPEVIRKLEAQGSQVRVLDEDGFVRSIEHEMNSTQTMMERVGLTPN